MVHVIGTHCYFPPQYGGRECKGTERTCEATTAEQGSCVHTCVTQVAVSEPLIYESSKKRWRGPIAMLPQQL